MRLGEGGLGRRLVSGGPGTSLNGWRSGNEAGWVEVWE